MNRLFLFTIVLLASRLSAQQSSPPSSIFPKSLATITTDTGDFAPRRTDFHRYTTPGLCWAAAAESAEVIRNTPAGMQSYDTLRWMPDKDTLPVQVIQLARACGARFTVANTPANQWDDLFDLAIIEENDSLAQAVLAHQVAAAPSSAMRDSLRLQAIGRYLNMRFSMAGTINAEPARPQLAKAIIAQIDSEHNVPFRLLAHETMLQYAFRGNNLSLGEAEVAQIVRIVHQTSVSDSILALRSMFMRNAYDALADIAHKQFPSASQVVAQLAQGDLKSFTSDAICKGWMPQCRTASVTDIQAALFRGFAPGDSMSALHASYWFPPRGEPLAPVIPAPGKITIVVFAGWGCTLDGDYMLWFHNCFGLSEDARRWEQRYGADGVSTVIIHPEWGWAFLSAQKTEDQEAERIRWYYQDFYHLPVTVGVQKSEWSVLPPPDNRRKQRWNNTADSSLVSSMEGFVKIVGRDGKVHYFDNYSALTAQHPEVDTEIERLLHAPSPSQVTATSSTAAP